MPAALALVLAFSAPLAADEGAAWRAVDSSTGQLSELADLEQLARDFPDSSSVRLRLLNAQMANDDFDGVASTLEWLKSRGYVFSEAAQDYFPHYFGDEGDQGDAPINAFLIPKAEVLVASEVVAVVPAEAGLIEGVFVPEDDDVILATSITGNSLHLFMPEAGWTEPHIANANDLSGIVSEPDNSIGWIASSNLDGSQDDSELFTGLIGLAGDFNNQVRVPAPEGVAVSDLTIGRDATVYASDPIGGGIYRKPIGGTELEAVAEPGTFRSPQGLALSEDGKRLYVSDYRYGLAIIDLASGGVHRLVSDVPAMLDGIDGLFRHGNELIAIQNGTSPMRITAFALSDDGERITGARTLEQAHPDWTEPLGGSISGGALYYIATGQWDRYDKGVPVEGKPAIPTEVRRLPLGSDPG